MHRGTLFRLLLVIALSLVFFSQTFDDYAGALQDRIQSQSENVVPKILDDVARFQASSLGTWLRWNCLRVHLVALLVICLVFVAAFVRDGWYRTLFIGVLLVGWTWVMGYRNVMEAARERFGKSPVNPLNWGEFQRNPNGTLTAGAAGPEWPGVRPTAWQMIKAQGVYLWMLLSADISGGGAGSAMMEEPLILAQPSVFAHNFVAVVGHMLVCTWVCISVRAAFRQSRIGWLISGITHTVGLTAIACVALSVHPALLMSFLGASVIVQFLYALLGYDESDLSRAKEEQRKKQHRARSNPIAYVEEL